MKQITSMILAGIIGGLITLGGFYLIAPNSQGETVKLVNQPVGQNYSRLASDRVHATPFDFTEAAERTMPAVVHITAKQNKKEDTEKRQQSPFEFFFGPMESMPKQGTGSGVIIDENGYIVTNNHVVDFADDNWRNVANHVGDKQEDGDGGAAHVGGNAVLDDGERGSKPALCEQVLKKVECNGSIKVGHEEYTDHGKEAENSAEGGKPGAPALVAFAQHVGDLAAEERAEGATRRHDKRVEDGVFVILVWPLRFEVLWHECPNSKPANEANGCGRKEKRDSRIGEADSDSPACIGQAGAKELGDGALLPLSF